MASVDGHSMSDREGAALPRDDPHPQHPTDDENASQLHVEEEEDPLDNFAAVISALNLDALPQLAAEARQKLDAGIEYGNPTVGEPMTGAYHILYPLDFADNVRWIVKVPLNGVEGKWDELSAAALTAEANTMRILKRETTIPLPQVFDFSSTTDNKLGCPYILMSFISGRPLQDVWFPSDDVDLDTLHSRRVRALEGVASAMLQLGKYTFDRSGSPLFDSDGNITGIGPLRCVDRKAELDRWFVHGDLSNEPVYVKQPASSDAKGFYTFAMDLHPPPEAHNGPKGSHLLLRDLVSWLPEPVGPKPFVLTHPDFDIQNVLVSEDGQVQGIIDWDGVAAVPRAIGNESYPSWLTRDWDPMMYRYEGDEEDDEEDDEESDEDGHEDDEEDDEDDEDDEGDDSGGEKDDDKDDDKEDERETDKDEEPNEDKKEDEDEDDDEPKGPLEDSPETLKRYRQVYRQCLLKAQRRSGFKGRVSSLWTRWSNVVSSCTGLRLPATSDDITRQNLITQNLAIAASNPACLSGILRKVTKEILKALGKKNRRSYLLLEYMDIEEGLAKGELDESVLEDLKAGFENLLELSL
ncbi:hypothetical protein QQX98_003541 [Neonectria punicea]|uniref:Aminoglycoside phosphotransferase domain-containing protein n=1 Tax=Neonectria punicea TaxID=979145 RepID=A0ABR1HDA7_9HYPO